MTLYLQEFLQLKLADGSISNTEFQYLNGVSSAIQTQLDAKNATITGSASTIDTESLTARQSSNFKWLTKNCSIRRNIN